MEDSVYKSWFFGEIMRWKSYVIIFLVVVSGVFYYNISGNVILERERVFVSRVIDGDTVELGSGLKARLKGINTPEKGMLYYQDAKEFLVGLIENKSVYIESFGGDKYGRILVYVFLNKRNLNKEILQNGFGHLYYYDKDQYFDDLERAEEFARLNGRGIWKKSSDVDCVNLVELKEDEPEKLVLENVCSKDVEVLIKDEATHIYHETLEADSVFVKETSHIWNTGGDSLWVWDEKGLLVFYRY